MTRSTWNPNAPRALGLEFLGVGSTGYSFTSTSDVQQRGLRFRAQRTGPIDRLTIHSGFATSIPTLGLDFSGHRFPYVAELVPRDQLDTGAAHTLTPLTSRIQSHNDMVRSGAGGAIQSGDLATVNGIGVSPTTASADVVVDLASGTFPLDRQIASFAITWSAFASNIRVRRRGDLNLPIGSDTIRWSRVLAGGTDNHHLGEFWVEGGDTATWHEVTPQMIREFDSTTGGERRLQLTVVSFNPNFAYDLLAAHVDHFPERRIGTGVIEAPATGQRNVLIDIPFHAPGATGTPVDLVAGEEYVLVIRNPYGGFSDYSSASLLDMRVVTDQRDEAGTVTHFSGLDWDWHALTDYDAGDTDSGTRDLSTLLVGLPTALFSITGSPTVDSQPYLRTWGGRASEAPGEVLRQHNVPNPSPLTEYRSFRFNVSLGQTFGGGGTSTPNDPLQIEFVNPGTDDRFLGPFSIAPEEVDALESTFNLDDHGHMYFPVTVDFGEGVQFPSLFDIVFTSVSDADRPWRIAVLQALTETGGDETYEAGSVTYSAAAPVVTGSEVTSFSTEVTSHPLNIPATVNAGDLLIAMGDWRSTSAEVPLDPTGWTRISNDLFPHVIVAKVADGTEGGTTVDLVTDVTTTAVGIVVRILGQHPTLSEAIAAGPGNGSGSTPSTEPNPPEAVQPATWFTAPVRALAIAGWRDDDVALVSNPAGYTAGANGVSGAGSNAGAGMAFAHRALQAGSEDPGPFTLASNEGWDTQTLLIRPEPDAGGATGSFATGFALDPVTNAVVPLNDTTLDDLEFTLFTQAPEVTGLDVSVLVREGEGATCDHLQERPPPSMLTESFDKADGPLGPDLTWSREVYDHQFELKVVSQEARFAADQSGTWTDVQVPTPNFTGPDGTISFDVTSVAVTGSDEFTVEARAVSRLQLLGEGDSYRGYVARIARTNTPSDTWTLSVSRADGAEPSDLVDLVSVSSPESSVTLPGRLTFSSRGEVHTATFTHAGSGDTLEVVTTDSTYDSGVFALSASVNNTADLLEQAITVDDLELDELVVEECTVCRRPQITYPRVCWSPTQLDVDDFDFFELQRRESGQTFKTVEVFPKEDPSVTALGTSLSGDVPVDEHPAPSLTAVGDELLFCHWHSFSQGDYSVTGTGMDPLGTVAQITSGGSVLSTPNRDWFNTSQLDIRMKIRATDWTPAGFFSPTFGRWTFDNVNDGWLTSVTSGGQLSFQYTEDGATDVTLTSGVATGFADGTTHWLRFLFIGDDGAGQNVMRFFTSEDGVNWAQLGATQTNPGTVTIWDSTAGLRFNQGLVFTGDVYHLEVRNGDGGPVLADPSFHSQLPGTTTFEDNVGNVWSVTGAATIVAANELRGPDTSSIAAWEQVSAGATGTRFAEIVPDTAYATMSVLVRGVEGPPVFEEVVTNLETDGVTLTTSDGAERGEWLLALFGSPAGSGTTFGPPEPGSWQLIVDSGETTFDRPRVAAWVRPVVDDGGQVVELPQTDDPNDPLDYHLRVVRLSNVSEFMVTCYDDWSVAYGNEVCYRVRQGRADGSISDWSPPVCETVPAPEGVDLVITAPTRPELNAAYNEAHARLPTQREFTFLDADDTDYRAVYGRDNQLAFRPLETRGVTFRRNLLVSPFCEAEVPCLEALRPLRDLMTEPVPFLVVRDTCGNRWYASLTVSSALQFSNPGLPDLWTAQVEVVELAAPIIETPAGAQET